MPTLAAISAALTMSADSLDSTAARLDAQAREAQARSAWIRGILEATRQDTAPPLIHPDDTTLPLRRTPRRKYLPPMETTP